MTPESIQAFLQKEKPLAVVKIELKRRTVLRGVFVKTSDYDDLRVKNFWRIVPEANLEQWNKKQDNNLLRIYNGAEFTKLASTAPSSTVKASKQLQ
jgi:hypothetical protein